MALVFLTSPLMGGTTANDAAKAGCVLRLLARISSGLRAQDEEASSRHEEMSLIPSAERRGSDASSRGTHGHNSPAEP
jgi:hypothetical protein